MTQTHDSAATAGDLISRAAVRVREVQLPEGTTSLDGTAIRFCYIGACDGDRIVSSAAPSKLVLSPPEGSLTHLFRWNLTPDGAMEAHRDGEFVRVEDLEVTLRALPAAAEAGEAALPLIADYLRAPHMDAKREIDERARTWIDGNPDPWVSALSAERDILRARLAEVEAERDRFEADAIRYNDEAREARAERDAALSQVDNLRAAIAAKGGNEHYPTEDAYLAACRAVDKHRARANAAEAAQAGEG